MTTPEQRARDLATGIVKSLCVEFFDDEEMEEALDFIAVRFLAFRNEALTEAANCCNTWADRDTILALKSTEETSK